MSLRAPPSRTLFTLDRVARFAVLVLPLLLLHAHGIAEVAIAVADLCFLATCAIEEDWHWLRTPWIWVAGTWWLWLVICSCPIPALDLGEGGPRSLLQAVLTVRFLLLLAAMEGMVLKTRQARDWMFGLVAASALWIGVNCLIQDIAGRSLLGWPRSGDGELTGPFFRPRAGPALARILLPSLLPPVSALLSMPGRLNKLYAVGLLVIGIVVMVLIGQRMPLVIAVLGLVVAAVVLRRLRGAVLATVLAGIVVLAASPVVAPDAYYRLVEKFSHQLEHFAVSPYGQLYARALQVGEKNPVTGMGFNGFGTGCPRPAYFRPTFDGSQPDGGGAKICWDHPHNTYLQALDDGGFVGLGLFAAMAVAWLIPLGRGLWRNQDPLRVGLFAAAFIQLWPIQSTSAFTSMPIGGWFFLLLGWGLAEARFQPRPAVTV